MRKRYFIPLGLFLLAGLFEGSARLALPWLTRASPTYYYRQYLRALTRPDPVLVWMGKPRAEATIVNPRDERVVYRTNGLGWRDREFNPLAAGGNALVLGDSFTFGTGVSEQQRYTEHLERAFRGLEVWNLGVMGYAPDQYLLLANRWLPPVPWKLLLVQLSNNDLADVAEHVWQGVHTTSGEPAALAAPPSHAWVSPYSEAWNLVAYFGILQSARLSQAQLEAGLRRLLFSMRAIARLARARDVPMVVVQATDWGAPAYGERLAAAYRDGVTALAREENFILLEAGAQELLPAPDLHWTPAAHQRVGEMLIPVVQGILFPPKAQTPKKSGVNSGIRLRGRSSSRSNPAN